MSRLASTSFIALLAGGQMALADVPRVAADIAPIHGLVSMVMGDLGQPDLIIPPGASPHFYAMRPSEARALSDADLVLWVGAELAPWFVDPLETLAPDAVHLSLLAVDGTRQLEFREGATFEAHDHGDHDDHGHDEDHDHDHGEDHDHEEDHDHGHEDHDHEDHDHEDHDDHAHDDHGHDDHDEHGHEEHDDHDHDHAHDDHGHDDHDEHAHDDHGHDDHDDHAHDDHGHDDHDDHAHDDHGHDDHEEHAHDDHGHDDHDHDHHGVDPHAWLDPVNAALWLDVIAAELSALDPENADTYAANAAAAQAELSSLSDEIAARMAGVSGEFVVFHDAYHYFEARFGVEAAGALTLADATPPSPARVAEIRDLVQSQSVTCVFAEPQFDTSLVENVFADEGVTIGRIDPLGFDHEPGATLYPALIRSMADSFESCLSE